MAWVVTEEAWPLTFTLCAKVASLIVTVIPCTVLTATASSARASAKPVGMRDDLIVARWETIEAKIPGSVRGGLPFERRTCRSNHNVSRGHTPAIGILNHADESSSGVLRSSPQAEHIEAYR